MGYKVKKGDGWYKIAKTLGVNVNELLKANNATLDTLLHPDLELQTTITEKPVGVSGLWGVDRAGAAKEWSDQQEAEIVNDLKTAKQTAYKNHQVRKDKIYKGLPDRTYQESLEKDKIQALQSLLRSLGYDIGKFGVDGIMGNATKTALAKAQLDGYELKNNFLSKTSKPQVLKTAQVQSNPNRGKLRNKVLSTQKAVVNGEVVDECARFGNCTMRDKGYIANGDAWTRHNNQKTVYSGFNTKNRPQSYDKNLVINYNLDAADNVASNFNVDSLDKDSMYSVGMYYMGSPSQEKAYNEGSDGATNTHTGNLMFDKNLNDWIVRHNVHGTEITNRYSDVLGSKGKYGITGVYQPHKNNFSGKVASFIRGLFKQGGIIGL